MIQEFFISYNPNFRRPPAVRIHRVSEEDREFGIVGFTAKEMPRLYEEAKKLYAGHDLYAMRRFLKRRGLVKRY